MEGWKVRKEGVGTVLYVRANLPVNSRHSWMDCRWMDSKRQSLRMYYDMRIMLTQKEASWYISLMKRLVLSNVVDIWSGKLFINKRVTHKAESHQKLLMPPACFLAFPCCSHALFFCSYHMYIPLAHYISGHNDIIQARPTTWRWAQLFSWC